MHLPRTFRESLFPRLGFPCVFIHTPKCGGTFLEEAFGGRRRHCPTLTWPEAAGHRTYREFRDVFRARGRDIHENFLFSVVRNPWAWHVSWFFYIRDDAGGRRSGHRIEHELFRRMSFRDYLDWLEDPDAPRGPQGYIARQLSDWVVDESGAVAVDLLMRQERLAQDLAAFRDRFGLRIRIPDAPANSSRHADYRTYYDDGAAERIASRHARDIALFGYAFDGPPDARAPARAAPAAPGGTAADRAAEGGGWTTPA